VLDSDVHDVLVFLTSLLSTKHVLSFKIIGKEGIFTVGPGRHLA